MASSAQNSSFAPFTPTLPVGYVLHDYIIEEVLGKGGFGITYLAREEMTDYLVVIKENYPSDFAYRDPTTGELRPMPKCEESYRWALESFEKEARTLRKLPKHPTLVHIIGVFPALNTAYIVMERIDGKNLAELYPTGSKMEPHLLEGILHKLLNALIPMHRLEIIHRDIKPANIMLTPAGEPVLIDFGAARPILGTHNATQIGTREYAPPEQMKPVEDEDGEKQAPQPQPHWDLYALGCTCHQLITGYVPVSGARTLSDRPELQGLYSSALLASIDKAHEKDPADRWQSAQDWLDELSAQHKRKLEEEHRRKVEEEQRVQRELEDEKQKAAAEEKARQAESARQAAEERARQAEEKHNSSIISSGVFKFAAYVVGILLAVWLTLGYTKGPEWAVQKNYPTLLRSFFYLPGVDVNKADKDGSTPLYEAASLGRTECVKLLIASGADVNKADKEGRTPLYWAAVGDHAECVELLIASGADVNKADKDGETPLYHAASGGHTECVKQLIEAKADVNKANNWGYTPLYWAAYSGHTECVKQLIAAGADVNKADKEGQTPLHCAARHGRTECVKQLIAAGADVNKADKNGQTPLHAAKTEEIKRLLRTAGAR